MYPDGPLLISFVYAKGVEQKSHAPKFGPLLLRGVGAANGDKEKSNMQFSIMAWAMHILIAGNEWSLRGGLCEGVYIQHGKRQLPNLVILRLRHVCPSGREDDMFLLDRLGVAQYGVIYNAYGQY